MNNYSRQRELVLQIIKNTRIHPTAEEVYNMVQLVDNKISKSTVYRNINILVDNKIIKKITMSNGPDRFDYLHEPHHHAICTICGKVFDFCYDFDKEKVSKIVKSQTGIDTDVNCISINGICNNCKSK